MAPSWSQPRSTPKMLPISVRAIGPLRGVAMPPPPRASNASTDANTNASTYASTYAAQTPTHDVWPRPMPQAVKPIAKVLKQPKPAGLWRGDFQGCSKAKGVRAALAQSTAATAPALLSGQQQGPYAT